ncbi:hypothetical protein OSB04_025080 [Centaurea solstitialis]|uniref:Uncharacterized protein n=1 Tax=Centaurea solstitialis TaxID=347529 RepID=A0AA38SUY7_9ASTR|nr:hypothetical protein OSB04_025080 [Centaurea solstitialis]
MQLGVEAPVPPECVSQDSNSGVHHLVYIGSGFVGNRTSGFVAKEGPFSMVLIVGQGLRINLRKSKIYGLGISEAVLQEWARRLGCEWGYTSFRVPWATGWHINEKYCFMEAGDR